MPSKKPSNQIKLSISKADSSIDSPITLADSCPHDEGKLTPILHRESMGVCQVCRCMVSILTGEVIRYHSSCPHSLDGLPLWTRQFRQHEEELEREWQERIEENIERKGRVIGHGIPGFQVITIKGER